MNLRRDDDIARDPTCFKLGLTRILWFVTNYTNYRVQLTLQRFTVKLHLVVTQHQFRVALVQV